MIQLQEYLGNSTTQSLQRLQLSSIEKLPVNGILDGTPSLSETKIAKIKLPAEDPPVPSVHLSDLTLKGSDANCENVSKVLEEYGVCIVKEFMKKEQLERIKNELDPIFETKKNDPRLFPKETIRVTSTVSKSPAVVKEVLTNPLNIEVCEKFLAKKNAFWIGENLNIGYSPSIVSSSIAFRVGPGAPVQALHRDDHSDHNIRRFQKSYEYGSESQVGVSVALSKVTKENGGTRFIPGSHLWDHFRKPHEDQCIQVELDEGDGFFMLASVFHGAGSNVTENQFRTLLILFMCNATGRQKENIYLQTPVEYFQQFNPLELKHLGLTMSEPFSGMLELQDPLVALKPGYVRKSNYSDVCKVESI